MAPHSAPAAAPAVSPFAAAAAAFDTAPAGAGGLLPPLGGCGWGQQPQRGGAGGAGAGGAAGSGGLWGAASGTTDAPLGAAVGGGSPFASQPFHYSSPSGALPDFGSLSLAGCASPPVPSYPRPPAAPFSPARGASGGGSGPAHPQPPLHHQHQGLLFPGAASAGTLLGSPSHGAFAPGGAGGPHLPRSMSADVGVLAAAAAAAQQGGYDAAHLMALQQQGLAAQYHAQRAAHTMMARAQSQQLAGAGGGGGRGRVGSPLQQQVGGRYARQQDGGGTAICPVFDMKSLAAMLGQVQAGSGDVRRVLGACTFKPRLPGLTKLVSNLTKEGHWAKALEVYESLDAVGVRPDTTITNAAISSCDKGGQWEAALALFRRMADAGMGRDAITYSALISALSKGRQWGLAIHVFNHMVQEGVECDAVTCCSLITALDKGGQWQLAEQVFRHMYCADPSLAPLLAGMEDTPCGAGSLAATSMQGAFSLAALDALSGGGGSGSGGSGGAAQLPPAEELVAGLAAAGGGAAAAAEPASPERLAGRHPSGSPLTPPPGTPGGGDDGAPARDQQGRPPAHGAKAPAGAPLGASPLRPPGPPPSPFAALEPATAAPLAHAGSGAAGAGALAALARAGSGTPGAAAALGRAGSGGLARAGSLSTKKASPNRVCCNALLASYARAAPAQWARGLALLRGMWACGGELTPDIVSYNTAIKAAGSAGQVDVAFELYGEMRSRGIEPTAATFGALLALASEGAAWGRVAEAWGWLQASGLPVHVGCANTYLAALLKLLKLGDWAGALQVFAGMKACGGGLRPNTATFNLLIAACSDAGQPTMALNLFDDLVASNLAPNQATLSALAAAHARAGAWGRAADVLRHMGTPGSGAPPTAATYAPLFGHLSEGAAAAEGDADRASACARAADLYTLMLDQGVAADAPLYSTIISVFAACGAHAMVLRLALTLAERRWPLDEATLGRGLAAAAAQGAWDLVPPLLRGAMEGGGARAPAGALRALLVRCAGAQAWTAAEAILQCCTDSDQLGEVAAGFPHAYGAAASAAAGQQDGAAAPEGRAPGSPGQ
ncbi:MAG: hypothetical protein J3K34DRAFT_523015 [Monoraphidium minutum]|nr:MAG: hypothetical protein J3K34DRAFT_523015 [Monoraphidium minutum]